MPPISRRCRRPASPRRSPSSCSDRSSPISPIGTSEPSGSSPPTRSTRLPGQGGQPVPPRCPPFRAPVLFALHAPPNVDDLRGMIVASTYPLYPSNQPWSYSYQGDRTHVFSRANPARARTTRLSPTSTRSATSISRPASSNRTPPLTHPGPDDTPRTERRLEWSTPTRQPPIWIGMVGNKGHLSPEGRDEDLE